MFVVLVVAAAGATALLSRATPGLRAPLIVSSGSGEAGGAVRFGVDSSPPEESVALLFYQGRPTSTMPDGRRSAVSEGGSVVVTDERLRPTLVSFPGVAGAITSAAALDGGDWWLALLDASLVRVDAAGEVLHTTIAPFGSTVLWPIAGRSVLATRSPERFSFMPEPGEAPLHVRVGAQGASSGSGQIVRPEHGLLGTLANAGYSVVVGDTVYFAPLSRAEVIALDPSGKPLWRLARSDGPPTPEPRFKVESGRAVIDYQPYNLALTLGPDGALYRLRAMDTSGTRAALDIIDRGSGTLRGTADVGGPRLTMAANARGRLYHLDESAILGAVPAAARERVPAFEMPDRSGASRTLVEHRGKVVLLNFWASWCLPCEVEMPALDSLQRELTGERFAFVALNADADRKAAERFLDRHGLRFPVAFGGPDLRSTYHYPGLPYTLLVDAEGRLIRRWIGQLSGADLRVIRALVAAEPPPTPPTAPVATHQHH